MNTFEKVAIVRAHLVERGIDATFYMIGGGRFQSTIIDNASGNRFGSIANHNTIEDVLLRFEICLSNGSFEKEEPEYTQYIQTELRQDVPDENQNGVLTLTLRAQIASMVMEAYLSNPCLDRLGMSLEDVGEWAARQADSLLKTLEDGKSK